MNAKQIIEAVSKRAMTATIVRLKHLGDGTCGALVIWSTYTFLLKEFPRAKAVLHDFCRDAQDLWNYSHILYNEAHEKVMPLSYPHQGPQDKFSELREKIRLVQQRLHDKLPLVIKAMFGFKAYSEWCIDNDREIDYL